MVQTWLTQLVTVDTLLGAPMVPDSQFDEAIRTIISRRASGRSILTAVMRSKSQTTISTVATHRGRHRPALRYKPRRSQATLWMGAGCPLVAQRSRSQAQDR